MFKQIDDAHDFFNERQALGIRLGTDRMEKLLQALDHPQKKFPAIHVAGTNGKGSTIHFASSGLIENGYKVGVFTSPSLEGLEGHFLINHEKIPTDEFLNLLNEIHPIIQRLDEKGIYATEFEIITALAFLYFSRHVDIAFIETGMGGREDTTNCFVPILTIITNIDNDHMNFLGTSLEEITSHKVGIMKKGTPTIIGDLKDIPKSIVTKEASKKRVLLYQLYKDFTFKNIRYKDKIVYDWFGKDSLENIEIKMYGNHQVINSSIALFALSWLHENNFSINERSIRKGFLKAQLPGRFEHLTIHQKQIILDGSHNVAGIQSFIDTVQERFAEKEKKLIFSAFIDKEIDKMLELLLPFFGEIHITTFSHQRAMTKKELKRLQSKYEQVTVSPLKEIIKQMKESTSTNQPVYFFIGSLHFVKEVSKLLLQ